jgi:hypothetical protein
MAASYFEEYLGMDESQDGVDIAIATLPESLTSASKALRSQGFFGSEDVKVLKRDGTEGTKSVATHNHERVLRYFKRIWKTEYSEIYDCELTGSTILTWSDLSIKPSFQDKFLDMVKKAGLYDANASKLYGIMNDLLDEQEKHEAEMREAAKVKAAAEKAQADHEVKDAALKALALAVKAQVVHMDQLHESQVAELKAANYI